jgi:hypothetical protein
VSKSGFGPDTVRGEELVREIQRERREEGNIWERIRLSLNEGEGKERDEKGYIS